MCTCTLKRSVDNQLPQFSATHANHLTTQTINYYYGCSTDTDIWSAIHTTRRRELPPHVVEYCVALVLCKNSCSEHMLIDNTRETFEDVTCIAACSKRSCRLSELRKTKKMTWASSINLTQPCCVHAKKRRQCHIRNTPSCKGLHAIRSY